MPFDHPLPRPFTISAIRQFAPLRPGVYGLSNAREWIYIGSTGNIQSALLDHMNTADSSAPQPQPTGFVFEISEPNQQAARQAALTLEYRPSGSHRRPRQR